MQREALFFRAGADQARRSPRGPRALPAPWPAPCSERSSAGHRRFRDRRPRARGARQARGQGCHAAGGLVPAQWPVAAPARQRCRRALATGRFDRARAPALLPRRPRRGRTLARALRAREAREPGPGRAAGRDARGRRRRARARLRRAHPRPAEVAAGHGLRAAEARRPRGGRGRERAPRALLIADTTCGAPACRRSSALDAADPTCA